MASKCIEETQPGESVFGHDGKAHHVRQTLYRPYRGRMIGIRHARSLEFLWLTDDHLVLTTRRTLSLTPSGDWSGIPVSSIDRARDLRKNMPVPEALLWSKLRGNQLGVKVRRQHQIGPFLADFYIRKASLVIEVDGDITHGSVDARTYDRNRDAFMSAMGLTVLRFTASDVLTKTQYVLEGIVNACSERVLDANPTMQWRYARNLHIADGVYVGAQLELVSIVELLEEQTTEDVYDLEVGESHSFLTDVCGVHDCGRL